MHSVGYGAWSIPPAPERESRSVTVRRSRAGFSTVDVMVTISVVAVLLALLLPALSGVKETARRIECSSNVRQLGIGIALYADDFQGFLPTSVFRHAGANRDRGAPQEMMTLRAARSALPSPLVRTRDPNLSPFVWDGLGLLFDADYLRAPEVFYCPSHTGDHPYLRYAGVWNAPRGEIVGNYHYRGIGAGSPFLAGISPSGTALVSDGLRTVADYNHKIGNNVLRADLTVSWFPDPSGQLAQMLADGELDVDPFKVEEAWQRLDFPR